MTTLTITHDATAEVYPWDVVDQDGDIFDSFDSKAEALAYVAEQRDEEEATELRETIAERMEAMGVDGLRALAAFLKL